MQSPLDSNGDEAIWSVHCWHSQRAIETSFLNSSLPLFHPRPTQSLESTVIVRAVVQCRVVGGKLKKDLKRGRLDFKHS